MKSTIVLATANSRLHADIMMIRLRRAGINIDRVSAIFSNRFAPNSFFFWLRSPRTLKSHANGDAFFAAGPLQQHMGNDDVEHMPRTLRRLGLSQPEAAHFAQSLWLGHGVLCVQVKNQDEAAIVWHIFKHSRAEDIAIAGLPVNEPATAPAAAPSTMLQPAFAA